MHKEVCYSDSYLKSSPKLQSWLPMWPVFIKFTSNLAQQLLDIDLISLLPVGSTPADRSEREIKRDYLNIGLTVML